MSCCHMCNLGAWVVGVNKRAVEQVKMFAETCPAPDPAPVDIPPEGTSFSGTSCLDCFTPTAAVCDRGRCTWAYVDSDDAGNEILHPQPNRLHRAN